MGSMNITTDMSANSGPGAPDAKLPAAEASGVWSERPVWFPKNQPLTAPATTPSIMYFWLVK